MTLPPIVRRLYTSTVVWSWAFNFLRLASGLLLLPLLLRLLPDAEFGMYFVFLSLSAVVTVLDLGFSPTIGRFVSYAMGGATELVSQGVSRQNSAGKPNYPLLWQLLETARVYYGFLVVATFVLLGTAGTFVVSRRIAETASPGFTWLAWGVSVAATSAETYFNVWNVFLRNMNQVLTATRIYFVSYAVRLVLACVFLLAGAGLLALPAASLITSLMIWSFSRRQCLRALSSCPPPAQTDWRAQFKAIWPNSWRLGLYFGGAYLTTNANVILCTNVFGLSATSVYGFSTQVVTIVTGMAGVWTLVKWPYIGQLVHKHDTNGIRAVLWPRVWLQVLSYLVLVVAAIGVGPALIRLIHSNKQMLPILWMVLLGVYGLMETHCSIWNTLISMWNELPMLWPTLAANAMGLLLNIVLVHLPGAHPGLLVIGPLAASAVYNYWHWPRYGARTLHLGWAQFMRSGLAGSRGA